MVKIVIDAGHGYNTPGKRSPVGEREWYFNDKVVRAAIEKLLTYKNVEVLRVDDSSGKTDVPLQVRTDIANAWNADVYVSIHHNALTDQWDDHSGIETFTSDAINANPISVEIAAAVHPRIVKALGIRDRGMKRANFHVLRETKMPAILTEGGFIDSRVDIIKLRDEQYLKAEGEAIAEGLAKYIKLEPKVLIQNQTTSVLKGEEEIKMYKPTSTEIIQSTWDVLRRLERQEDGGISNIWSEKLLRGTLTDSDAIGLLFVALNNKYLDEEKLP